MTLRKRYTLSIFHLLLLTSSLLFLDACRAKHTDSLRKMYPGELRPEEEIALVVTWSTEKQKDLSARFKIIEIDGINTEHFRVIEVEPGTHTCLIQFSGSSSYVVGGYYMTRRTTTSYKSVSALNTTFIADAGYLYYPSGTVKRFSKTWEPKVMYQPIELVLPQNATCFTPRLPGGQSDQVEVWRHYRSKGDVKDIK